MPSQASWILLVKLSLAAAGNDAPFPTFAGAKYESHPLPRDPPMPGSGAFPSQCGIAQSVQGRILHDLPGEIRLGVASQGVGVFGDVTAQNASNCTHSNPSRMHAWHLDKDGNVKADFQHVDTGLTYLGLCPSPGKSQSQYNPPNGYLDERVMGRGNAYTSCGAACRCYTRSETRV